MLRLKSTETGEHFLQGLQVDSSLSRQNLRDDETMFQTVLVF
jgi:hypothetical protein